MAAGKIISIHSYRGGTGKSNITANLAACLASRGQRVAVLDTDIQSPGVHVLFGFDTDEARCTLVDFLWGRCSIEETAYDVTSKLGFEVSGKCWLIPSSMKPEAIARILEEGYDANRLNSHFDQLLKELDLDYLLIDTHPGLNKETMLSTAISDILLILIRPDQQDLFGTAIVSQIAKKLEVPQVYILANKAIGDASATEALQKKLADLFQHEVIDAIPLSVDFALTASRELFVAKHPNHEISKIIHGVAERILADQPK